MLQVQICFFFPSVFCQELNSSLVDRDRAICERNELLEKYCHEVKDKAEAQKELSQACKDIEMVREERDVARKERTEAIIQRDQLLREYYQARQVMDAVNGPQPRLIREDDGSLCVLGAVRWCFRGEQGLSVTPAAP